MNSRIPIIAANWKMHKTCTEAEKFLEDFLPGMEDVAEREIIIAPPFTALHCVAQKVAPVSGVSLAAQNMHYESHGAYTGEISPPMLRESGVEWVILGHSERRHVFNEDNEFISLKVQAAFSAGLKPILCVGELLEERESGRTFDVLQTQLEQGLNRIKETESTGLVVAYEPVWAIGTGRTATPGQAQEAHGFIRAWMKKHYGSTVADSIRILYGGSVKPDNIDSIMSENDVDGVLVGGASLAPDTFSRLVHFGGK